MKWEKEPNMRERVFKAFLDLIILRTLQDQPMTGYRLVQCFHEEYKILSTTTRMYKLLQNMEKKKWIKQTPSTDGKTYNLTPEGQQIANNMNLLTSEIRDAIKTMIEK